MPLKFAVGLMSGMFVGCKGALFLAATPRATTVDKLIGGVRKGDGRDSK